MAAVLTLLIAGRTGAQGLIEGFEDLSKVKSSNGALKAVVGGEGTTEGSQAAQFPGGATLQWPLRSEDCQKAGWLKIDTMTTQAQSQSMRLVFSGTGLHQEFTAIIQPGKDTLAVPMPWVIGSNPSAWKSGTIDFTLTNAGKDAAILDNVRFEPAASLPKDTIAIDFGSDTQALWPGFSAGGTNETSLVWSGSNTIHQCGMFPLDPLTAGSVGPAPWTKATDSFEIKTTTSSTGVAWLWVDHEGGSSTLPPSYAIKHKNRLLAGKSFTRAEGMVMEPVSKADDAWTPAWFDKTYAPTYYDLLRVELSPGKNKFDIENCRVAAMIVGPASEKAAIDACVEQVKRDVTRFRRQLIVGQRRDVLCDLDPREAEDKAGMMVFAPPPDDAFVWSYSPKDKDRVQTLHADGVVGGKIFLPLAVVPLKKTGPISATVSVLKGPESRSMGPASGMNVWLLHRVPRIMDAGVHFQPWIAASRHGGANAKEILQGVIVLQAASNATPGAYKGSVKFSSGTSQVEVPIEVDLSDLGGEPAPMAMGSIASGTVGDFYRSFVEGMPDAQQDTATLHARQELAACGITSLMLPGLGFSPPAKFTDDNAVRQIKACPPGLRGPMLFSVQDTYQAIADKAGKPGTQKFQTAVNAMISKVSELGRSFQGAIMFFGVVWPHDDLSVRTREAADLSAGKACIATFAGKLAGLGPDEFKIQLTPLKALMVWPDSKEAVTVIRNFRAQGPAKQAFLVNPNMDRYMSGFYAAACGAEGLFLTDVSMNGGVFAGFNTSSRGLLVPTPDGSFLPTLMAVLVMQGHEDFSLFHRAKAILAKGKTAGLDVAELEKAVAAIVAQSEKAAPTDYDANLLRTGSVPPSQLETWRTDLIRKAAAVQQQLKKPS